MTLRHLSPSRLHFVYELYIVKYLCMYFALCINYTLQAIPTESVLLLTIGPVCRKPDPTGAFLIEKGMRKYQRQYTYA